MRTSSSFRWVAASALSLSAACASDPGGTGGASPGISGAALASTLSVHVEDELGGDPLAGATVDVGGAAVTTDAAGDATLTTAGAPVTLRVSAAGRITERWIGVDRDHATVALATPIVPRTVVSALSLSGDAVVSAATSVTVLRTSSLVGSTGACTGGTCELTLALETREADVWSVVVDATSAHLVTRTPADGRIAIAEADLAAGASMVTLAVTLPSDAGLQGVVGVPGLATDHGVALFPAFAATPASVLAPAREGPFADARLWYVARGTNADGSGQSVILDRDIGADGVVTLPSGFLAIPSATASGSVGIDVDPEVDLYVVEAYSGADVERAIVLHPSGAHVDVPISLATASRVVVRAIDAPIGEAGVDLGLAERSATRMATLEL